MLMLFGGLPAVGKTTISQKVAISVKATYLRIDTLTAEIKNEIRPNERHYGSADLAQLAARVIARDNLHLGRTVVVDAYNGTDEARHIWRRTAEICRSRIIEVSVFCGDRAEHRSRADARHPAFDGDDPVPWERIIEMKFEPWPQAGLQLDTAGKTAEAATSEVLLFLAADQASR